MHDDLIEVADHLARRDRGKPRQASLRKAISTAYYAVFHAVCDLCARELVGWSKPWEPYAKVYRAIDHQSTRRVLIDRDADFSSEMGELGAIFVHLQENRLAADYDPRPRDYGRTETLEIIDMAKRAIGILNRLPARVRISLAATLVSKKR